ncbi:MAG: hypothetical protein WC261_04845 [Synergistaceae bacterium]|jgi:hypothetical protein|nr:hypothetical protein [Candidatus Omnitrophota bacterium]
MKRIDNEEGSVYTVIWIFLAIGLAGFLYLASSVLVEYIVGFTNDLGADGMISAQTSATVATCVAVFLLVPVIVVIGALVYNYVSSVDDKRRLGGI